MTPWVNAERGSSDGTRAAHQNQVPNAMETSRG